MLLVLVNCGHIGALLLAFIYSCLLILYLFICYFVSLLVAAECAAVACGNLRQYNRGSPIPIRSGVESHGVTPDIAADSFIVSESNWRHEQDITADLVRQMDRRRRCLHMSWAMFLQPQGRSASVGQTSQIPFRSGHSSTTGMNQARTAAKALDLASPIAKCFEQVLERDSPPAWLLASYSLGRRSFLQNVVG